MIQAKILGIQGYLPENIETNDDLAGQNSDWDMPRIAEKTGILARHIAAADETAADMGYRAAASLLERELVPRLEIDYLIVGSQTPDHFLPSDACLMQDRLGLGKHIGAFDYRLGCSGYGCGLQLAKSLIESSAARNVLLVTTDTYSKLIHPRDRTVRALFGDGAAATLIGADQADEALIGPFVTGTDGSQATCLQVPSGGFRLPRDASTAIEHTDSTGSVRSADHLFMDGQAIFSFALNTVPQAISQLLAKSGTKPEDVSWWVFHQANRFMLENLAMCCRLPADRLVVAMETVGNTVAASIPLAIEQYVREGKIRPGQRLVLVGFGVGLSWNACEVVW
jgi:3-oxoacyl-[acyl-carrier-protein] synthase III